MATYNLKLDIGYTKIYFVLRYFVVFWGGGGNYTEFLVFYFKKLLTSLQNFLANLNDLILKLIGLKNAKAKFYL